MSDFNTPVITPFWNGMVMVSVTNTILNTSSIGFTVGSRNDPPWFVGAAHKVEHDLIHGATEALLGKLAVQGKPLPISARALNRVMRRYLGGTDGPGMNVFTMHSHTGYGHDDVLHRRDLHKVFHAFALAVREGMYDLRRVKGDQLIDRETFEVERAAVDNETGRNEDDSYMRAYKAALKLLYRANPARNFGDSEPEQLARVKRGRLKHWAQQYYVPDGMRIIIMGPDSNEALRMVRKAKLDHIPKWEKPPTLVVDPDDIVPVLTDIRRQVIERPRACMLHRTLLWPTETYTSADRLPLIVLADVLKDRIEDELRENNRRLPGGVYHPSCDWEGTSTHGFLQVWFATRGDRAHADELLERTLRVIRHTKDDVSSVFTEDVEDARGYRADEFQTEYRYTPAAVCDRILGAMANGDPDLAEYLTYCDDMLKVTPRRVREIADKYLHGDRFIEAIIQPVP